MKALSKIRQACEERRTAELEAIRRDKAQGRRIAGYTCHSFPAALLAGLGLRPVRVLCGTNADSESAGEKVVRPDICPFVKTLLGNVNDGRGLHGDIDLWIGLFTCDQMRRAMDKLAAGLGKEVYQLQLPATRTPAAAEYYAEQVRRVAKEMEVRHGVTFDPDSARRWQKEHDKAADALAGAARSGRVSPLDLHAMFHLFFVARPEGLADFFADLIRQSPDFKPSKTILLSGSPLTQEDTVLLEELETRGYGVLPLNCTGLNAVEQVETPVDGGDLIRASAHRSFYRPACMRTRPNTVVYERIRATVDRTKPAGIIVKSLKFCDHWYTERERLRRSFNLPVLVFDSDYAEGGRERLLSRIDAFLETIE